MQSGTLAIRPAEHHAGDFIRMPNAHQQEWGEGAGDPGSLLTLLTSALALVPAL
jgi:hypothetical protein